MPDTYFFLLSNGFTKNFHKKNYSASFKNNFTLLCKILIHCYVKKNFYIHSCVKFLTTFKMLGFHITYSNKKKLHRNPICFNEQLQALVKGIPKFYLLRRVFLPFYTAVLSCFFSLRYRESSFSLFFTYAMNTKQNTYTKN